jgi:predicted GTPase
MGNVQPDRPGIGDGSDPDDSQDDDYKDLIEEPGLVVTLYEAINLPIPEEFTTSGKVRILVVSISSF